MLHYLRIAVTALSLTACALLIALWVRSYWWVDVASVSLTTSSDFKVYVSRDAYGYRSRGVYADSCYGVVSVGSQTWIMLPDEPKWEVESEPDPRAYDLGGDNEPWRIYYYGNGGGDSWDLWVNVPHWFLVILSALVGIAPWICWSKRFSLRTLLIAITLVAVALAAIVYASR